MRPAGERAFCEQRVRGEGGVMCGGLCKDTFEMMAGVGRDQHKFNLEH